LLNWRSAAAKPVSSSSGRASFLFMASAIAATALFFSYQDKSTCYMMLRWAVPMLCDADRCYVML
jgi:hypothetical protein